LLWRGPHFSNILNINILGTIVADLSEYFNDGDVTLASGNRYILLNQKLVGQRNKHRTPKHNWFALDEDAGILLVRKRLDREAMCQTSEHCTVNLQVSPKKNCSFKRNRRLVLNHQNHKHYSWTASWCKPTSAMHRSKTTGLSKAGRVDYYPALHILKFSRLLFR